jgi:thiazole synthase ThiGH ThiG subunit
MPVSTSDEAVEIADQTIVAALAGCAEVTPLGSPISTPLRIASPHHIEMIVEHANGASAFQKSRVGVRGDERT